MNEISEKKNEISKTREKINTDIENLEKAIENQSTLSIEQIKKLNYKIACFESLIKSFKCLTKFKITKYGPHKRKTEISEYGCLLYEYQIKLEEFKLFIKPDEVNKNHVQLHRTAQMRINSHRQTLWEEQKHFTWWISIVFSGLIFIISNNFLSWPQKSPIVIVGCLLGLFLSIIGIFVIKIEGSYFKNALQNIIILEKHFPFKETKKKGNIRSLFITIYIFAILLFLTVLIYFCVKVY